MADRNRAVQNQRRLLLESGYSSEPPFVYWESGLRQTLSCPQHWYEVITTVGRDCLDSELPHFVQPGQVVEMYGPEGFTPLHFAAALGFTRTVKYLLEQGACASVHNRVEKLPPKLPTTTNLLSMGPSQYMPPAFNVTPLFLAASEGHVEVIQLLLQYGAKPEHEVTLMSDKLERFLPDKGQPAVMESLDLSQFPHWARMTALEIAAREGHAEACRILADAGACPRSSLVAAAIYGHGEVLQVLLNESWPWCELHMLDLIHACSVLFLGGRLQDATVLSIILDHPCLDIRLSKHAPVVLYHSLHALCGLMRNGSVSKVRLLVQHGVDFDKVSDRVTADHAKPPTDDIPTVSCCGMFCAFVSCWIEPFIRSLMPPVAMALMSRQLDIALFLLQCGCSSTWRGGKTLRQVLEKVEASPDGVLVTGNGLYEQFKHQLALAEQVSVPSLQMLCRRRVVMSAPGPKRIQRLPLPKQVINYLLFYS